MATQIRRLVRLPDVLSMVGMRKSNLYALVARGDFPAPVKIGPRFSAWVESDVQAWIDDRIAASHSHKAAA